MAHNRTPIQRSRLKRWKGGPVRDWTTSPRLFTARPKDASKRIVEEAVSFCQRYQIPIRALCRHMAISEWAFRQARDSVQPLPVMVEKLLLITIERIKAGKVWLTRKTPQRRDLEFVNPPYKNRCPMKSLNCFGGLLPGSCPRHWRGECAMSSTDWQSAEEVHKAYAAKEAELRLQRS
jgi:hypothetical protein